MYKEKERVISFDMAKSNKEKKYKTNIEIEFKNNEILDIYNENGEIIGSKTRGEIHKKGYLHKVIHCWFEEDKEDGKNCYFQQRAMYKSYPGLYGVMVGGHIDSGEDEFSALKREISEEAGIIAEEKNISFINQITEHIVDGGFIDNEICEVYRYKVDDSTKFKPNEEVAKIVKMDEKEYKDCVFGISDTVEAEVVAISNQDGMEQYEVGDKFLIHTNDFCEYDREYVRMVTEMTDDEYFMREALREAKKAYKKEETPIGAIIVKDGKIVGRGHNLTEYLNDATAHSEILAIKDATKNLGGWRLFGCKMYVTMEPCIMCCGAIVNSRIRDVVIGAKRVKNEKIEKQSEFKKEFFEDSKVKYKYGIMEKDCAKMLTDFFKKLR
ncbi:deaminase [Peptacetobacter sp.]|uniref:deaminase n=1 Tax=Peptacetobacter sp. TaxID=2991975 RepID=UPI002ED61092